MRPKGNDIRSVICLLSHIAGVALRVPPRLWPNRQAMGFHANRNLLDGPRGGIEHVHFAVETAGQPQPFSIRTNITHVGTTAARDRPLCDNGTSCEVDDAYAARTLGTCPFHFVRTAVCNIEL